MRYTRAAKWEWQSRFETCLVAFAKKYFGMVENNGL